jgi:serine protein kinase
MTTTKRLEDWVQDIKRSFTQDRTLLSFHEYYAWLLEKPYPHIRSSAQYWVDMFQHYGTEERDLPTGKVTRFKLFNNASYDHNRILAGQEHVQEAIYRTLCNFAREGKVNKLIVLHGPNGSAKSSLCRALMASAEHYSHLPEGALYSFSWVFPSERIHQTDRIGFGQNIPHSSSSGSFAHLPSEHIDARIPCDMHDHPLFLIPPALRTQLLQDLTQNTSTTLSEYLTYGDLCYKCRRIYDTLLTSYEGDASKVLNHIQIERFYLSRRYRRGLATLEPQMSVDARIQQITADRSLTALPKALQHTSLYEPSGPLVDANRGLLEYSDLLKRPVESFKYLLASVETANVVMESFVLHLDMVLIASTNETYLEAFKEHPDFPSFKGRMELIKVPYLVRYSDEKNIYLPQVTSKIVGKHVAPHAIDVAALWAVLTRMRRCDASLYDKDIADLIGSLTPLEKLHLYDTGETPERFTTREVKEIKHFIPKMHQESLSYPNYEGRFGASAREIRTALLNAAHHDTHACLHPLAVFEELQDILNAKSVYDFLRQEVLGQYHDHKAFLSRTQETYLSWIDNEIRDAMGLAEDNSYMDIIKKYVLHISHWVKQEKIQDPTSGHFHHPDEHFMGEIEKILMSPSEHKDDFRRSLISTIGARSLESPQQAPDYAEIFKHALHKLREDFYTKKKKILKKNMELYLKLDTDEDVALDPKEKEHVLRMRQHLQEHAGYCTHCAKDTVAYLLKKRYADA